MRITGGSKKGQRLSPYRRADLRPTSEKVRAAVFSIIGLAAVQGARVLDLYAGTGALGIEALSRGASWADFVEVSSGQCRGIRNSLRELGLTDQSRVYQARVEKGLDIVQDGYDLVFADPPYSHDPWDTLMYRLGGGELLNEGAQVVVEHFHKRTLAEAYGRLTRLKARRYGDSAVSIYMIGATDG